MVADTFVINQVPLALVLVVCPLIVIRSPVEKPCAAVVTTIGVASVELVIVLGVDLSVVGNRRGGGGLKQANVSGGTNPDLGSTACLKFGVPLKT